MERESDSWQMMEGLFLQALEQPAENRRAFLRDACPDPAMRRTVEELLESDGESLNYLERPLIRIPRRQSSSEGHSRVGEQIGHYRLLRRIGEGGMSTVYLAEPRDPDFEHQVAIKVVRHGMESKETARRLRIERQILAGLEHPCVATLHDGGTTEDHLPYFVMEYVDGVPIDEFCDQQRWTIADRLALFREVCSAVHYAHQSLVVHRDLKPSNILVTAGGSPKLLDFGIAKLLDPELMPAESEQTASWLRVMTPSYASPEQFCGQRITTASDIYSLGVLLYKLLTGGLPRSFTGLSLAESEHMFEQTPDRPSQSASLQEELSGDGDTAVEIAGARRASPEQLRRELQGDLDSIVLKALRSTPEQRFGSVEQLSEDVRRYLAGLPVLSHKGTWRYRVGKFMGRHAAALTIAAMVTAVVLGLFLFTVLQSARIARERDKNVQLVSLMESVFGFADPERGQSLTVKAALRLSEGGIRRQLQGQPETQAALLTTIGRIYLGLGLYEDARLSLEESVTVGRRVLGEDHPDVAYSMSALALAHGRLSEEDAETLAYDALNRLRTTAEDRPVALLTALNQLVAVLCILRDFEGADTFSSEAVMLGSRLPGEAWLEALKAVKNRAIVLSGMGDYVAAEAMNRRALETLEAALGDQHPLVGETLNSLGSNLRQQKRYEDAEALLRRSLAIRRENLGEDHPYVANSYFNLGNLLRDLGRSDEAAAMYRAAADNLRVAAPENGYRLLAEIEIAELRLRDEEPAEAERLLRESLKEWQQLRPESYWLLHHAGSVLGECLTLLGRYDEAERLLHRSLEVFQEQSKQRQLELTLQRLVVLYRNWDRPMKAAEYQAKLEEGSHSEI